MESRTPMTDFYYFSHTLTQTRDPKSFPNFGHSKSDGVTSLVANTATSGR